MPYKDPIKYKKYQRKYRQKPENKLRHRLACKKYREKPEGIRKIKEYNKAYIQRPDVRKRHKKYMEKYENDYRKKYNKEKRETDANFMIKERLRASLYITLKLYTEQGKIHKSSKYGINWGKIIKKLTPLPFPIMEKSKWHIDHIIPVRAFDLTNPEEVKKCFNSNNLQWLPAKENISKGANI